MSFNRNRINLSRVRFAAQSVFNRQSGRGSIRRMMWALAPVFCVLLCLFGLSPFTLAQNIQHTQNTADSSLRGDLQVDPSTLGMTLSIPLGEYPGRNGVNLPVTLSYGSKQWRIDTEQGFPGQSTYHTQSEARYAEHSMSGWTSSLEPPEIQYLGGDQSFSFNGDTLCAFCIEVPPETPYYIDRLLVHMPDGSSHELRKSDMPVEGSGLGLGGIYYAVDGSQLKFDANTATLYMPDGSRYLLAAPGGVQFIDRNGNTLSYNSPSKQWTDTLGRVISSPPLQNSAPGDLQYSLPGFGGASRMITFRYRHLIDARTDPSQPLRYKGDKSCPGYPETTLSPSLFNSVPVLDSVCWGGPPFNPVVLWQIVLPNNSAYTFTYNIYGEIDKVVLPTGGYQRFRYEAVDGLSDLNQPYKQANRGVVEHWVSAKGDGSDEASWQYFAINDGLTKLTTMVIGPTGARSVRLIHKGVNSSLPTPHFGYEDARAGRAYEERTHAANGVMIRRTLVNWMMDSAQLPTPRQHVTVMRNPRGTKKVEILLDTGGNALASTTTTSYDADLNVIATNRYDYVPVNQTTAQTGDINSFPLGTLLRTEETTFLVNDTNIPQATRDAYRARHLISLPSYTRVKNGATIVAETQFKYDEAAYPPLTYGATPTGWTNPNANERGNMSTTRTWLNVSGSTAQTYPNGSFLEAHAQYDQCGNLRKTWNGNAKITETFYADSFSDGVNRNTFAYATSVTTPIPDPTGNFGSNQPLTSSTVFEFNTGKVVTTTDANNKTTSYFYTDDGGALDSLQRLRRVTLPDGLGETKYEYGDAPSDLYIRTLTKQDATTWLESRTNFDGLGRAWRSGHYEGPSSWSVNDTEYDALGRVKRMTNPYFASNLSGATPGNAAWTTTTYDDLNRVLTVTAPDGATVETTYSGNQVTVKDPANKKRLSMADAMGRLARVVEDPDGVAYQTDYSYDTFGNLTVVNQGGQYRYFFYDSLGRLMRVKNPEQSANSSLNLTNPPAYNNNWSIAYSYDANGNLVSKTDARNITTNYTYDALNRNTTVNYSDTTVNPDITRFYDNPDPGKNSKGRFWRDYSGGNESTGQEVEHNAISSYDALGRPLTKIQKFKKNGVWSGAYSVIHTYDLAGNVKSLKYPSDRTVNYSYDQTGRLSVFSGNLGGSPRTYADTIGYNAAGQMIKERFGTNTSLYHNNHYNNRQQLVSTRVGNSATEEWNWSRGAIDFFYGATAVASGNQFANDTDNNGNLRRQDHYVPLEGGGSVIPQRDDYTYDALNRISSFTEIQMNSSGQWTPTVAEQNFSYDPYGNRRITGAIGEVSNYNPGYDLSTNRINGLGYDAAGNIISDPNSGETMTYDAENRLRTATKGGGGNYFYNADGKRVRRITSEGETWYVYGCGGELLAEYAAGGAPSAPQKEYGYRGGELLIIAESGSGGGVSFVKPALKSSADLIGKAGLEADGKADGLFVVDEPAADLEFNEDSGSATADVSSDNSAGTLIDGTKGTTAGGYGSAPSFNGVDGELLAERPPAAPGAPQKEYGYRGGPSIVTVQGGGVVNISPTANQSPDPGQGGVAVNSPINTGHGGTLSEAVRTSKGSVSQTKTCLWHSFSGVTGTRTRVTLKLDWTLNASINASAFDEFAGATAGYDFKIEYSLDNGSTWTVMRGLNDSVSIPDGAGGSDSDGINTFGSESVDLPNPGGVDITQIRVRDRIFTNAAVRTSNNGSASSNATASVSLIRLEVDTVPVITGVSSSAVTHNSATISWTTNEPADSQVEYGTNTAYGQSTTLNPTLVTAHSQGLSGLTPGMLYHYRVRSRDATGNLAVSDDLTFTTSTLDTTAPVISNVAAGGITATSATITWNTNENSDSRVEYGTTTAYGQSTTLNTALVTAHSQGLSGLTGGTSYHYRVKSKDAAGNLAVSGDFSFTTAPPPDTTAPVISNVAAAGITATTATITWTTDENSDSQVEYGTTTAYGQSTTLNPALVTAHSQVLSGLTAGTLYYYRVKSKDAAGNLAVSGDFSFTTAQNVMVAIKWLVTDDLGSTRMVIDETGSLEGIKRHDFAPFGEELSAGIAIRSASNGYSGDSVRQKFTGFEHDDETDFDFAEARYYSATQGRFTSPDPLHSSAEPGEPQSWNRYAYVGNRPTVITDPSGLRWAYKKSGGNYIIRYFRDGEEPEGWTIIHGTYNFTDINGRDITIYEDGRSSIFVPQQDRRFPRDSQLTISILKMWGVSAGSGFLLGLGAATTLSAITVADITPLSWQIGAAMGGAGEEGGGTALTINPSGFIDPNQVRFSQEDHSPNFSDTRKSATVDDLAEGLRSGSVKASDVPPIRIVSKDGVLYTLDNRRLAAFQRAGVQIPYRMATPEEYAQAVRKGKFSTKNEGTSIKVRTPKPR
jgi:RHS repeat-associated protein